MELAAAAGGLFLLLMLWGWLQQRKEAQVERRFEAVVQEHLPVLLRKRRQLLRADDYGIIDRTRWEREIAYFLDKVAPQRLETADVEQLARHRPRFEERLEQIVAESAVELDAQAAFEQIRTGAEFEVFCADELRKAGWQVTVTAASRDQGADVIAVRGRERLVVQCKLLSRPVGNGAVQEVVAARSHADCNRAMVVSNQRFTASAEELAASNGVELRHWSELAKL